MNSKKNQDRKGSQQVSGPTHIKDLVPDPANRRSHNPRNIGMVVDALHQVGAARSIVIDEDNVVLAGNGVLEAAGEAGITRLRVIEADGQEIIAVRRTGLSEAQKRDLAIYDNRTAELAQWSSQQFRDDLAGGEDFSKFFTKEELAAILGTDEPKGGLTDPDEVPAERPTGIVAGDLFELGQHRLLCGDCTNVGDVARLMAKDVALLMNTDPPYGVGLDLTDNHEASNAAKGIDVQYRHFKPVTGDDLTGEQLQRFLEMAIRTAVPHLSKHAAFYLWHPMLTQGTFFAAAAAADILIHRQIIWVKPHFIFGRGDYHWKHELCFYGWQRGFRPEFYGERNQDTVWVLSEGGGSIRKDQHHPTQKPVELFLRPIQNHTQSGDIIYEPFAGSGSQFMAAEQTQRGCLGLEIEPGYCQVIIDRWEKFTGQKAQKVGEAIHA